MSKDDSQPQRQEAGTEGIGIEYDHQRRILQLVISQDDGKPKYIVLERNQALQMVQTILDVIGIASKLLELDPSDDPPH